MADAKVSKELTPFNGTHQTYKTWANRIKDLFIKKNSNWHYNNMVLLHYIITRLSGISIDEPMSTIAVVGSIWHISMLYTYIQMSIQLNLSLCLESAKKMFQNII